MKNNSQLKKLQKLPVQVVNNIRAEILHLPNFPFQVAHINLSNFNDPSAVTARKKDVLTIVSDLHSYSREDRIFPINQDENSVFAQCVFQDCKKYNYKSVLDLATGSGVIAMAAAKAGIQEVIATDINTRSKKFIEMNNQINSLSVKFIETNLFGKIKKSFDKITINPPFMPAPKSTFPLHAQGGVFGIENVVKPFFEQCWQYINKGGCIQGIFHSFANQKSDIVLDTLHKCIPSGWSYSVKHVFPVKDLPIELYSTSFAEQKGYSRWLNEIKKRQFKYARFYMLTIRNDGKSGCQKEEVSKPRMYNLIYPPTTLNSLSKYNLKTILLNKPISEKEYPIVGHLIRLARYNYFMYLTLSNLLNFKQ